MLPATQGPRQEPALRAPQLRSQQAAELGLPASLTATILPARKEGCKHSRTPFLSLGPCLCRGQCGSRQPCWSCSALGHPVGATTRRAPGSEQSGMVCARCCQAILGMAGLPHLLEPRQPRHRAPAAAPGAVNLREQEASHTTRCFPDAGQPRLLWHSPLPPAQGCQHQWSITGKEEIPGFPNWDGWGTMDWDGMPC